ncbi:phosphoribosylanthranilate isomerase [Sulfurovum sp. bin170]|uniref:phosphoribosylanthranilate isomerase n=1 Tax=Sulfurovum sp. bin170 TaxID=2695268 RepID=UPI0013E0E828|nr:phosphoribosylanthranilate isomerase [Sulfurovum sp. bin170]NEW60014.1 phosphoribosylanthranilate isomerase [Sulfurovum sp. bin170]
MRVKICGITNLNDALQAVKAGADALGFVFYRESPRYITPTDAKKIIDKLPPFVGVVGLFVNEGIDTIDTISKYCNLTVSQIHFDVDEEALDMIGSKALPVIRAKEPKDILQYADRYRLVDVYCEGYGGSGKRLNLEWFEGLDCSKIILAGGLTPANLHELKKYNFYGVDVSSGVERIKGRKDYKKVTEFIENAKRL